MAQYGISTADLPDSEPEPETEIYDDCWRTVELFMRIANQWRVEGGMRYALDYTSVRATFAMLRVRVSAEEFDGISVMERACVAVWSEEAEARRASR